MNKNYQISLLFNANKAYDRQVIEGIGEYLQASQCHWNIFIQEDFTTDIKQFQNWKGDGVIADFDNPHIATLLAQSDIPVVGIGGSYDNLEDYPAVPYVATDNASLIEAAFVHLKQKGLQRFAFYGIPHDSWERWACEREKAFVNLVSREGYYHSIFRGSETNSETWQFDMNRLSDWLQQLPTPIGIIAVTDARARHLLQACDALNLVVPDKIAVIGIDNEEVTRYLTRVSLSSVGQGTRTMGYSAAKLLQKMLEGERWVGKSFPRILIPATRVYERQSSDYQGVDDPYVVQAMHYIRQNACKGIKVEQVLDHIGISRTNLEARFKQERGHSIHHEIHQVKLNRASYLLASSELTIADVAEVCGYPSIQYMYSVFKKAFNQTPKEYRTERN
ncbi:MULTISPECIES: XylR family transcriptional regulator [Vibrio]|uniref:AraC family transcriptional regulator n=2 Tax=Vibrio TaxID=662 RepID=A0A7X4LP45_9VIBR|nr:MULTISPECIES: DNA-binding transcriptional regulator [Vibrio]MBF8999065.1 DNA-binding transcriptional regulator [Vibrio nitrifigilis]MZI95071.1 AraC family transcriptional regulator [Vibrio eleionomae]